MRQIKKYAFGVVVERGASKCKPFEHRNVKPFSDVGFDGKGIKRRDAQGVDFRTALRGRWSGSKYGGRGIGKEVVESDGLNIGQGG